MKKTIWVSGIIAGIISFAWCLIGEGSIGEHLSLNTRMVFGYATMLLAFSLIFVAIKNYRDNYNGGTVSFGKALQIGLLITLIASTVYVAFWMIDYKYFMPDFGERYQAQAMAELKASGASSAEVQRQSAEMTATMQHYKASPVFRALFTYLEIVPVGILVSLIAALILKQKAKNINANA